jgi:hypothetical protein
MRSTVTESNPGREEVQTKWLFANRRQQAGQCIGHAAAVTSTDKKQLALAQGILHQRN